MKVYIFNPENDMALADGKPGYTPPARIQQMRRELYWLPNWWAEEEDIVWDGKKELRLSPGDEILPWGWSPALIHQLKLAGVADEFLPTEEEMVALRQLSHRQTAVQALARQKEDALLADRLAGDTVLCHSLEEVQQAIHQRGDFVLKSPWSSSGRGVVKMGEWQPWTSRILRQQGSVVVERLLDKLSDFALEFWLDGNGGVEYKGLSLFYTNDAGAYLGNWVAPEGQKFRWLMQYADPRLLMDIRSWWEQYLRQFRYKGPVGVDMMLCKDGSICPCIEINWRMTMGYVSTLLPAQGKYGRMVVEYIYGHYSAEVEAFG